MTGRGLRGRQQGRLLLFTAFFLVWCEAFLFIALPPSCICPMSSEPPSILTGLVPAIGIAGQALGLIWMIRIYRADPEGHSSWFRFTRS